MNENKLFAAAADLDDRFVAETMQKKARPRGARFLAAAALLILVGAGFAAYKALVPDLGKTDENPRLEADPSVNGKYAFLADTSVPADAVLPPVQEGSSSVSASYVRHYTIPEAFADAEEVVLARIGNWLDENDAGTFYEATPLISFKGELEQPFVLWAFGNSEFTLKGTPLFTYGDTLLLFLTHKERPEYANSYECIGADLSMLYASFDKRGDIYLIDHRGIMSYIMETECTDVKLTDLGKDGRLFGELCAYMRVYNEHMASALERYFRVSVDDAENVPYPLHVYKLEEVTEKCFNG